MVEFAGWEMPLKYDSADKSKVAGSPGEGPLPRAQRRFSTGAQVGFTSSCRTPPSSKVRRSFRCRTHGPVDVCALSPQAGPGCHTRIRLLTSGVSDSFTGPGALAFLSHLLPASLSTLPVPGEDAHRPFGSTLSVLLNEQGGILDDCMITRWAQDR